MYDLWSDKIGLSRWISYGIINEHQLISGECTDYAKVHPDAEVGKRIFYTTELSNIAMERCKTSREAVELIGTLIDKYGYYDTGETLIFRDPKEVWIIEMWGGTPSGTGGYWLAQKVPNGEIFVAANEFRIRGLDSKNPDQIFSRNLLGRRAHRMVEPEGWPSGLD